MDSGHAAARHRGVRRACGTEMFVMIEFNEDELAVPQAQLDATSPDQQTQEAIADWHCWFGRGYEC